MHLLASVCVPITAGTGVRGDCGHVDGIVGHVSRHGRHVCNCMFVTILHLLYVNVYYTCTYST